jgi:hypothetical protein
MPLYRLGSENGTVAIVQVDQVTEAENHAIANAIVDSGA